VAQKTRDVCVGISDLPLPGESRVGISLFFFVFVFVFSGELAERVNLANGRKGIE